MKLFNTTKKAAAIAAVMFCLAPFAAMAQTTYYITGSGTSFTARTGNATTGTIVTGADGVPIQTAIEAVKTAANKANCTIQFGNGTSTLNTSGITFDGSGTSSWGIITLTGNITSEALGSTIELRDNVSVKSSANIRNNGSSLNYRAITNNGTGTLTIEGGNIQTQYGQSDGGIAIYNNSTGTVNINGGTIEAKSSSAVYNNSTGKITVSGTAVVKSVGSNTQSTIFLADNGTATGTRLEISGGTVENSSSNGYAINNYSTGAVIISGGAVKATYFGGQSQRIAVVNGSKGALTISGGTVEAATGRGVQNSGALTVTGGTISTASDNAVYNIGTLTVSGGVIEATTTGNAIHTAVGSTVNISGGLVKSATGYAIHGVGSKTLTGGLVFAYGTTLSSAAYVTYAVIDGNYTTPSGNPVIIAWNKEANNTTYTGTTNKDIISAPAAVKAAWLNKGGKAGIDYANGANTGFIEIDGVTVDEPIYTVSATTPVSFVTVAAGYAQPAAQTVTIRNTGNISITLTQPAATNYVIGALSKTAIAVNETATFTVRPKAGLAVGNYNETITVSGTGGASAAVNASFTVSAVSPVITVNTQPAANITVIENAISGSLSVAASATLGGTLSYRWYSNTTASNVGGTAVSGATSTSFTIPTTLAAGTYYYFCEVSATGGATPVRSNVATVTVNTLPGMYAQNFEDDAENANWVLENGTQRNEWHIGSAVNNGGSKSLYISNDGGIKNDFYITYISYVYAYRVLNLAASGNYAVSFDWRNYGDYNDIVRAFLVPDSISLTAGSAYGMTGSTNTVPANWIAVSEELSGFNNWRSFSKTNVIVPSAGTYKLVFFWKNDDRYGTMPAAVDNIVVIPPPPVIAQAPEITAQPQEAEITYGEAANVTLSVAATSPDNGALSYQWYSYTGSTSGAAVTGATNASYTASASKAGTVYYYAVITNTIADNGDDGAKSATATSEAAAVNVAKASCDMSGITFKDTTVTHDGEAHSIHIGGTLPAGVTVSYTGNGKTEVGTYQITAIFTVEDEANYNTPEPMTATLKINATTSIASRDRLTPVPPSGNNPLLSVVLAGEFAVGPNPVAKSEGKMNFFWQGAQLENTTLFIYDASGNLVKKMTIADKSKTRTDKRAVGSWDLKDTKGRAVSEGSYVVKGAIKTRDGKKEKISLVLGVR